MVFLHFLLVVAGIAACEAIRKTDSSGEIALIGDEACGYYSRPGLAYYLTGELPERSRSPGIKNFGVRLYFLWRQCGVSILGCRQVLPTS